MKILTVVGARPQFVKAAVVSHALGELPGVEEVLVHTGQHYDPNMSEVFFDELRIPAPRHHLEVGSGPHGAQTGAMLGALERVIGDERPDWVMVYGDTNSTLAGVLAASKLHVPSVHVEAGLRSFNRRMPEEINRIVADQLSELLFAPTDAAMDNLRAEGLAGGGTHLVGDVMYDAALQFGADAARGTRLRQALDVAEGGYLLATIHRPSNTDDPARLRTLCRTLADAADGLPVLFPAHPRTRAALERAGIADEVAGWLRVTDAVGYLDMLALEQGARAVVTDSGGVQKEAFFFRRPCVVLRTETEWTELVELGWNRLADPDDPAAVARAVRDALGDPGTRAVPEGLYGGGRAAARVARVLAETPPEFGAAAVGQARRAALP
jgi:UDP-GlcNAc3NAcA epimerase